MPEIKLQHIVSCSSEDRNNPAENLLKPEGTHKWKGAKAGEKQLSVVIQFEKASRIHSMDIGNEGSAFVEVLVGKATASSDQDYQVLLVASSFMSPVESRNGTNRNSVRMFGADKLSKTVMQEKWDRVKIVCTQPFNKNTAYGLSFIKIHSPAEGKDDGEPHKATMQKTMGAFLIKPNDSKKDDSGDNDDVQVRAHFSSKDTDKTSPSHTGAAASARAASRLAAESKRSFFDLKGSAAASPSTASSSKPSKGPAAENKRRHDVSSDEEEEIRPAKTTLRKQSTSITSASSSTSKEESTPPLKKVKSEPPKKSDAKKFSELMSRVVFVLSGFQNPYRGELRDKALEMGAKYRPDWGRGCTHLICAFENTPKYAQVKGKGFIVTKDWISDCYKQKKLLPWRKYRLGRAPSPDISSGEEEEDLKATPKKTPARAAARADSPPPSKKTPSKAAAKKKPAGDIYGGDTDSGDDTEEEVRKVKAKVASQRTPQKKAPAPAASSKADVYGESTDEDDDKKDDSKEDDATLPMDEDDEEAEDSGVPELPDFFADKVFFLYGDFPASERRLLNRYVAAYNGEMSDYMSDKVNYVITSAKWDDNFDEALSENSGLIFVKPKWIHACHDKGKLLPYQPYIVVPS